VGYSPVWNEGDPAVKCSSQIVLSFNWDMDSASTCDAFTLDPPVEGSFAWEDSYYRLLFTPDDAFDENTLYTLTLNKSAEHGGGMPMQDDFTMQFYTQPRKHLNELAVFPYEAAPVHIKTPTVELRVDSMLNTYNLITRLRVLNSNGDELAWNKRSIKYNKRGDNYGFVRIPLTKNLEAGQQYQLVLDRDIADTAGIHLPEQRVINFTAVDAGADKPGMDVLVDFDNADNFRVVDPIGMTETKLTASTEALFGNKSLQVSYDLTSRTMIQITTQNLDNIHFSPGDTLGLHVWGDMSRNELYAIFANAEGVVDVPLGKIDFHGWKFLSQVLPDWYDDYRFVGFNLIPPELGDKAENKAGIIRFDNLLRKASSGINEARLAGMQVRVAGDYIVVSADTWVQGVELLDINAHSIKATGGNCLNISSVAPGIYLVRVLINGRTMTHKVIIQ